MDLSDIEKKLLEEIADLHETPEGAFNIRKNGKGIERRSTTDISIEPKADKPGIDIRVKPHTVGKSVHIPVILSVGNFNDLVYNDFYIGEGADVLIVAGCGIHNSGCESAQHDGIHAFHLAKGSRVRYVEKHVGEGGGTGDKILNPVTKLNLGEGARFLMETYQLGGVSSTVRKTKATLKDGAELEVREKLLTTDKQSAVTDFKVVLSGVNSTCNIVSRSVARDESAQDFRSDIIGDNLCFGHVECDAIVLDHATVRSTPKIFAKNINASLVHEAAIGKIAGDQMLKLMTLGLTEKEAEDLIIKGYLLNN